MSGEWIKFEKSTSDKPEVWQIAESLGIDPDAVVGKMLRVWSWYDDHTEDGNAPSVTEQLLDRVVGVSGFVTAVVAAGWMERIDGSLHCKNFARHNGQTAKGRALTQKRVKKHRNAATVTEALPEKKRKEKKREDKYPPTPHGGTAFGKAWDEWVAYRREKRKALTQSTAQKQLDMLAQHPPEVAIAMLEQSIRNGWTGLFALKDEAHGNGNNGRATNRTAQRERDQLAALQAFAGADDPDPDIEQAAHVADRSSARGLVAHAASVPD